MNVSQKHSTGVWALSAHITHHLSVFADLNNLEIHEECVWGMSMLDKQFILLCQ